ncbi:hypothetical protein NECAME_05528 [Necator americanus]|uniref:Neurotransmitter-gated ion-channel ligand-binding domain-containing protein n=1 Tax=Necator americanus TaxID=51031 RepID=W2SGK8_NECAM|nr:hypothetical protein NECAME_05528 [Necator americanus]ETN68683.1 hypothetical protein NECAME_05528 [Necator americanus]
MGVGVDDFERYQARFSLVTHEKDFQLDVYFQQFWKDSRLAHNETGRVLVRDKSVLLKMWHPDVYFANARIAEFHQVTQPNFLLWIEPDGSILYDTRISMVVVCTLNLEKWPLDSQRCHLRILSCMCLSADRLLRQHPRVSDAYTTDQLQIEWVDETPITRNPNIAMSDMHIVDLFPGSCDGNYSTVRERVREFQARRLKRKRGRGENRGAGLFDMVATRLRH